MKFDDLVTMRRATPCPTCQSFIYTLTVPLDADIEDALSVFGNLMYPMDKSKIIMLDSEAITISSMVGRTELKVKYKRNAEALKIAFRARLSVYLSKKLNVEVTA